MTIIPVTNHHSINSMIRVAHKYLILLMVSFGSLLFGFPISSYDFHTPVHQVSPVVEAMGGMSVTYESDSALMYNNPALLPFVENGVVTASFKMEHKQGMSFSEVMSMANILKKNQFTYASVYAAKGGFGWYPLASINQSRTYNSTGEIYREYEDYQLDAVQFAFGTQVEDITAVDISWGMSFKYIFGRLVYLEEKQTGNSWLREEFYDERVKGYSADLGFLLKQEGFSAGLVFYDLFSRLYWEDSANRVITKRASLGFQWGIGNYALTTGISRKLNLKKEQEYHLGIVRQFELNTPVGEGVLLFRTGIHSEDFANEDAIFTSFGTGYYIKQLRIDLSATTNGMVLKNNRYLISISVGL
ncbi:MAG: hypothetical protein K8S56_07125 [Candidatus Cloacimonetes bacterium]|nr:hypothetical protein [Candidatus Cloacimonadota bacterium]